MVDYMNEYNLNELDLKIRDLNEEIYENEKQLSQHNRLEREINEIYYRGNKIFGKLSSMWYQDKDMNYFIEEVKKSISGIERQTIMYLEYQKEELHREKVYFEDEECRYLRDRQNLLTKGD